MQTLNLFLIGVVLAGAGSVVGAQGRTCCGTDTYNPSTETTITGTVDDVKNLPSPGRGGGGLHLTVAATAGPVEVHVGPASFVTAKNVTFAKGDTLTVVGSKATIAGQEVLIAREITKGDQVLTLRDAKGLPLWAGRGGRTP